MTLWLVEEVVMEMGYGPDKTTFHVIVETRDPLLSKLQHRGIGYTTTVDETEAARLAFELAEMLHAVRDTCPDHNHLLTDEDLQLRKGLTLDKLRELEESEDYGLWTFAFSPAELEEAQKGYLWAAADGSSIWYTVRKLGEYNMDCVAGRVTIA